MNEIYTVSMLKEYIKKLVKQYIREDQLSEMATERKEFIRRTDGLIIPIIYHVLLLVYCKLYNRENSLIKHWKHEVFSWAKNLSEIDLKIKNDPGKKYDIIFFVYKEKRKLDDYYELEKYWKRISKKENIKLGFNEDLFKEFDITIRRLFDAICLSDEKQINNCLNNL
jgi:hypothetical protein